MPREIDSGALGLVNPQLGITSPGATQQTTLEDDTVVQVKDVSRSSRRSLADVGTQGFYYGILRNSHAAGGTVASQIQPYSVGAALALNNYPNALRDDAWDVYLGYLGGRVEAGTPGNFNEGAAYIFPPTRTQGWGVDDDDVAVSGATVIPLAYWDQVVTIGAAGNSFLAQMQGATGAGLPNMRWPIRIPRDAFLVFQSDAAGAVTVDVSFALCVYPAGMGQDIFGDG